MSVKIRAQAATIVLTLFLSGLTAPAHAAVKAGATCSKIGKTATFNGKKFTCVKSKKKLLWNKGVALKRVPSARPSPSATASPSPSATASPSPSATASPSPIATASPSPSATASPSPSATASPSPSATASPSPSATVASPTVSNASSLGCANPGGTCVVGDTGPGGGKVFYIQNGTKLGAWKYLEVAPSTWNGENEPAVPWCPATVSNLGTATLAGTGSANTQKIVSQCSDANSDFSVAAKIASNYRGGGKTDWFLPSKDELSLLFENRTLLGKVLNAAPYWSSSQASSLTSWSLDLTTGAASADENGFDRYVRPIRTIG